MRATGLGNAASVLLGIASLFATVAPGPAGYPLLRAADLQHVGTFRVPAMPSNGDDFSFGGLSVAYNPANNSLFVGSRGGKLAEISIPAPVDASSIAALPSAAYLQPFFDPTEGHSQDVVTEKANSAAIGGLLVSLGRLYGTDVVYYDASATQRLSHYSHSLNLSEPSFRGMYQLSQKAGYVSGYLATVPDDWQPLLGGPAITGQCCIPIVSRTSYGPSAFAWNPSDLGAKSPVPATPLFYYPGDHPLAVWDSTNAIYNGSTEIHAAVIPSATRTLLILGRHGTGRFCYGEGRECGDPVVADKGTHAYPYRYQIWAYNLLDLAEVKAGRRKPWDVRPYDVWPLELPFDDVAKHLGGVGYDAAHRLLYVSQMWADADGYARRPLIHVFKIR